jgi:tetratricopeptide (TPR) repeat protein/serine/threonine protein kinase
MSSGQTNQAGDYLPRRGTEPIPGYRLVEYINGGGYGEVWKAETQGGFHVALKFVSLDNGAGAIEMRALEVLRGIHHPNLVTTFGAWQTGGYLIIAMELADRTLEDRYREAAAQGLSGIPRDELIEYVLEAAKGIDYLNSPNHTVEGKTAVGVQHRDVKPRNILIVGGGVKVADFGLARLLEHSVTGHTGNLTPNYAPPEFFRGQTAAQSDQYSLAVAYCELRGGRLPFTGGPGQLMSGHLSEAPDLSMVPEEERPIVDRALAKEPNDRWPNCRAFAEALRACRPAVIPAAAVPVGARGSVWEECGEKTPDPQLSAIPLPDKPTLHVDSTPPPELEPEPAPLPAPPAAPIRPPRIRRLPRLWLIVVLALVVGPTVGSLRVLLQRSSPPVEGDSGLEPPETPFPAQAEPDPPPREAGPMARLELTAPPSLTLQAGKQEGFILKIRRVDCVGPIAVRAEELPPGVAMAQATLPIGQEQLPLTVVAARTSPAAEQNIRIIARADSVKGFAVMRLVVTPDQARLQIKKGDDLCRKGRFDQAMMAYSAALRIDPKYPSAHFKRGFAAAEKGALDEALADYNQAIKLDPRDALAHANRGLVRSLKNDQAGAVVDFDAAIKLNPNVAIAFNGRGFVRARQGQLDLAIADYDEAIRLDDHYAIAYSNRAMAHYRKGNHPQAVIDCTQAIQINPRYAKAYGNRGLTLAAQDKDDQAIADYNKAIALDAHDAFTFNNRGLAYYRGRKYMLALADFRKAIALDPTNPVFYENMADAYDAKGDMDGAKSCRAKAVELREKR